MSKLIAITGGIGSGKSVVCRILTASGFLVYNCDDEARRIMDTSPEIKSQLCEQIHPDAVRGGMIDRSLISSVVFSDDDKLATLNSIVHKAVEADLKRWCTVNSDHPFLFVETAILYQSGLDRMADRDWQVTAPEEVRIERVMKRNHLTREAVVARMASQVCAEPAHPIATEIIVNDGVMAVLPQVEAILGHLK